MYWASHVNCVVSRHGHLMWHVTRNDNKFYIKNINLNDYTYIMCVCMVAVKRLKNYIHSYI